MIFDEDKGIFDIENIIYMGKKSDLKKMGSILFNSMRKLDRKNLDLIIIRGVEESEYGLSIMNRLKKSASNNIRRV